MYIVSIQNGTRSTEIHNEYHKLLSGSVVKGINAIDSFTFSVLPDNPAFGFLRDFTTLVSVYNLSARRYEFYGRVLYTSPQMSDKGLITQEAVCESYLGFLCDSMQEYVEEQNWTVRGLLSHIIDCHNSQLEEYKHFQLGQIGVTDPNDNLYVGIQRENTWETIKKKLIDVLGGEIRFRVDAGVLYLDYVEQLGGVSSTEIALSKNMKAIVKEKNPSAFITRLIPLGAKIGEDTEERVTIDSVNDGKNYIDDAEAIAEYGLHVGYVEFDDVTEPANLLPKAEKWLKDNNKVSIKYSITALDLSLIGLDVDDFDVCNSYPLKNSLLGIDDVARINKKTIDVCDDTKTSIEIGESFKSLSELQREQMVSINTLNKDVYEIIRNYVTNQKLTSEITKTVSLIEQTEERIALSIAKDYATLDEVGRLESKIELSESNILLAVAETYATKDSLTEYATKASLELTENSITASVAATYATQTEVKNISGELSLKVNKSSLVSELNASADVINLKSNRLTIDSDYFKLEADGSVTASNLNITGGKIVLATDDGATSVEIANGFNAIKLINRSISDSDMQAYVQQDGNGFAFGTRAPEGSTETSHNRMYTQGVASGDPYILMTGLYCTTQDIETFSDASFKHDIELFGSRYDAFFDGIIPRRFKYNDGKSGRYHSGYVAQEIQAALADAGIDEKEFAAICTHNRGTDEEFSALRYSEFIALNTWQIQKLKARVKELEERLATL